MKKNTTLLTFFFLLVLLTAACKSSPQEAAKYNDMLVAQQQAVVKKVNEMEEALKDTSIAAAEAQYAELNEQIDVSIHAVKAMPPFDENMQFRNSTVDFLLECHSLSHHEYHDYLQLLHKTELSPDEQKQKEKLRRLIREKFAIAQQHFAEAQDKFKSEYHIKGS